MSAEKEKKLTSQTLRRILLDKRFIIAASILLVYTLVGFFLTPYLIQKYTPQLIQKHLQRNAQIGDVRTNPFLFTLEADNFILTETDGRPIAGFDGLIVDFELSSLFRWAWTFRRLEFVKPMVNLVFDSDGVVNLAKLAPETAEPTPEADSAPPRMVFQNVVVRGGEIAIVDQRQSDPATVNISPLNIELNSISTIRERKGPYSLIATTDDGAKLVWTGEVFLNPFRSTGNLTFDNIQVATLHEFVKDMINVVPPKGDLHIQTGYTVDLSGLEPHLTLSDSDLRLSDLSLTLEGDTAPFAAIEKVEINTSRFDLSDRMLDIDRVKFSGGSVRLAVNEEKEFELARIIKPSGAADPSETQPSDSNKKPSGEDPGAPWKVKIAEVGMDGLALEYRDASVDPASVAGIDAISLNFSIDAEAGAEELLLLANTLSVTLEQIHAGLAGSPEPMVRIDRFVLQEGAFDLGRGALTVARIGFEGGKIDLARDSEGELNILRLVAPSESPATHDNAEKAESEGPPFQFAAETIELSNFTANLSDRVLKPEGPIFTIAPLNIKISDVKGKSPLGIVVDLKIQEGGSLTASGSLDPSGPSAEADINIADAAIPPLQPYVASVANIVLHSGAFSSQGKVRYGQKSNGGNLTFDGGFKVAQLRITEPNAEETLLGWESLGTDQLKLTLAPDQLTIQDLRFEQPVAKLIIYEDGSVNLAKAIKGSDSTETDAKTDTSKDDPKSSFPMTIKKVRVNQANLDFADLTLTPQFGVKIDNLTGVVAGMSSAQNARAQVDLEGTVDQYGVAKIGGEINAFDPVGFTDISMNFRNIEMSSLTPYSGKFAGRKIDSGKLSLDLEYKIDTGQLLGDHKIVVDRIKLGEKVDSPDAKDLPLDLAVALMEDANGVIDIGLPVKGDLNDPEFSYGHLIGKAIFNLIIKIVTAPFRILGALIPGGSDTLDTVLFEPGESALPPPEKEKIKLLADALQKRPQLALEVQGRYSVEADGAALRELNVRRQVAAQLGTTPAPDQPLDPIDFSGPETQQVLEVLFLERFDVAEINTLRESVSAQAQKAKDDTNKSAEAEKAEDPGAFSKAMFAKLVESEPLEASVLIELAVARHQAIVEELVTAGAVAPERMDAKEPEVIPKGEPVSAKLSVKVAKKS